MGFGISDGVCNTGLGLALSCHDKQQHCSQSDHHLQQKKQKLSLKYDHMFPSLTLGLPQEPYPSAAKVEADFQPQASSPSAVSSFSNSSVKKEREFCGEEAEVERVSSRVSDEDEEGSPRKKLRLNKQQSATLENSFKEHSTLNPVYIYTIFQHINSFSLLYYYKYDFTNDNILYVHDFGISSFQSCIRNKSKPWQNS